jgi:hypothetical protein
MVENNLLIHNHKIGFSQRHSTIEHTESYKGLMQLKASSTILHDF